MKKLRLTMEKRYIVEAYVFMLPYILGVLAFFAFPLFMSLKLSFGNLVKIAGFKIEWIGFANYVRVLVVDINFMPMLLNVIGTMLKKLPLIIIFSLLLAMLINKNIKFKGFFRTALFIPFLLGTGYVMQQLLGQNVDTQVMSAERTAFLPSETLTYLGTNVGKAVDSFFGIIVVALWSSGVQILLFLSGLHGIPQSLYESAKMDSATEWEMFWHITLPMVSPVVLLNIVYTLIDSFTDISNPILSYIKQLAFDGSLQFEYAAAIGWIYFVFILLFVLGVFVIMKNHTYSSYMKGAVKK